MSVLSHISCPQWDVTTFNIRSIDDLKTDHMILDMAAAVNENHVTKRTPNLKSLSDHHEYEDDAIKDAELKQSIPQDKPNVEPKVESKVLFYFKCIVGNGNKKSSRSPSK